MVSNFAATQAQTQTGLASQLFGLTSASKSSPYLTGSSSDSKPRFVQQCRELPITHTNLRQTLLVLADSALGSAFSSLSSVFGGASSGSGLASYLVTMTLTS